MIATKIFKIEKKYIAFPEFYDENKSEIYKNIISLFDNFKNDEVEMVVLKLSAPIMGMDWEVELKYKKEEIIVLKRDLLPFYEKIEDYETCEKLEKLYNELSVKFTV